MQTDEHYLAEPVPDRAPHFNTDDEMVDSETDRKDTDFDIDLDSYSSPEGIEVDDVNNAMEDDYVDNAEPPSISFDNDDLMIDEEEDITYPVPQPALLSSHGSSDLPEASQDTLRLPSVQNSADVPLFSFSHQESSLPHETQFATQELPSVPDHSLYEDVPTDNVDIPEQVTNTETQSSKPDAEASTELNKDEETPRAQSPAKAAEEAHREPDYQSGDVQGHDSTELDNDFHHHGNWSENTSTTLAHEPNLLEDQREFEDEQDAIVGSHAEDVAAEVNDTIEDPATITGFAQYSLHPIIVQFGENRLSLFPPPPPIAEDGSIGSPINDLEFLIQDHDVCEKGVDRLFQELRNVLEGVVGKDVEFVMEIEGYGVIIGEDNKSCSAFSLQDILSFHVQLHQQDGLETPEPLQINLTTRPTLVNRIASLTAAVNQGIGFSQAVGVIESTIEDIEDSYMKTGDDHNENVAEENAQPEQEENQEVEYHNSDDDRLLEEDEESLAPEPKAPQEVYSNLVAPVVQKDTEEELMKVNESKADPSTDMKKVEEEIDDDDFDLEYGNEEKEEAENEQPEREQPEKAQPEKEQAEKEQAEKDHNGADEMGPKVDTRSPSGSSLTSEPPKPVGMPTDKDFKDTPVLVQIESGTEVIIEEISSEPSQEAQQPEEIQDAPSDQNSPEKDDEELIEYEEDNETDEKATVDLEHQAAESKELSHHTSSGQGSPQTSSHYSPPGQTTSHGSPHYSSAEHKSPLEPGSPHVHEDSKVESPAHSVSNESEHQTDHVKNLSEVKEDNSQEIQDIPNATKVPSSIPVFQGDDGAEVQYEYAEDQHQTEYDGYEYDNQELFELEEGEFDEENGGIGNENDAEYQEGFEYAANYPTDEQNGYLGEEGNEIPDNAEPHETYVGDGTYDSYEGEAEYSAQDADGYSIEYPEESYGEDLAAYEQAEFGNVNDIETAADNEFGVPVKEGSQSPNYVVKLLDKTSTTIKEVEEEQLIDYEDETELVQEKFEDKSSQHVKSPGDQKRMREDESASPGYGSDDENQAAKRVRAL
ncbi:uncharacterized protein LAJ45_02241 [Morchella importuna]|uniref:uncharacterized protein n=1 Tax=Morchella importuna TaxID=1174673 RepID=UPI001E8EE279|nr:uncharacterized protein LAJ45_02241 [Morchella importuna]KAH8153429.1 hypothetical protein LAJ45_02241 [Morchella importuna]